MKIEFIGEKIIEIEDGQSILSASLNSGIPHFHACGGKAKCSTCRIMVLEGGENLNIPNKMEMKLKEAIKLPPSVRLACQTMVVREPVKVDRMVKDQREVDTFLFPNAGRPGKYIIRPLGEEQYLVMFFVDLRNFTRFVETFLPFDVIYITRKLFDIFTRALIKYGGEIIETAGDEIFAIFGKDSVIDGTDSAIKAGQEILQELETFNTTYRNLKDFEVGIGVHAAKVIVGEFNIAGQFKKSVIGLGVNTASRLQDATKELNNSFIVSEEVMRQSSFKVKTESRMIRLKGISNCYKVYLLGKPYKASLPRNVVEKPDSDEPSSGELRSHQ